MAPRRHCILTRRDLGRSAADAVVCCGDPELRCQCRDGSPDVRGRQRITRRQPARISLLFINVGPARQMMRGIGRLQSCELLAN